jgi:hypothetical protein
MCLQASQRSAMQSSSRDDVMKSKEKYIHFTSTLRAVCFVHLERTQFIDATLGLMQYVKMAHSYIR